MSQLTETQNRAVRLRGRDLLLSAGAGSGKTRTLVARYLSLLEEGLSPQQVVAITFTEKAAREMRNRVREAVKQHLSNAVEGQERQRWLDIGSRMDAARIGTIHSLCAEILRAHPAEAEIDPEFEVVDEGLSATFLAQAVEDAVTWATGEPSVVRVFSDFTPSALTGLVSFLMARRLDAASVLGDADTAQRGITALQSALAAYVFEPEVVASVTEIREMQAAGELTRDAGDKLAAQLVRLLADWQRVEASLQDHNPIETACLLFALRREDMNLQAGKRNSHAKALLRRLREIYGERLDPWLGGSGSGEAAPDADLEIRFAENHPSLRAIFHRAEAAYRLALDQRYALDFDDLEAKAVELLAEPAIRARWQAATAAVLVDEFQDTNERQRIIVESLRGDSPGRLFVVGDARQSIYRFRGADVTVFRNMQREMAARGEEVMELDLTFRSHDRLLKGLEGLLAPIMGTDELPDRPYAVPYSSLKADREKPREGIESPFIEIILGLGETAENARPPAAQALVHRLVQLREDGQIRQWDEVALLFRASTGFQAYEDALEAGGVPFVTVAGRGFYDRPEIRDVLNILQALADPLDDLALAGLLRSPAFGLTDSALHKLRWQNGEAQPLHVALQGDLSMLEGPDQERALRACHMIAELSPLVDRLPVAELLKRVVDLTDYRAVLAASHSRLWRNLDKLLADAHASGLVRVRAFLEYIGTLKEVGAREGEAPTEAEGSVRLMTVHKAKGLEFEVVVIADAGRRTGMHNEVAYLLPEAGLAPKPNRLDSKPLITRLAQWYDRLQSEAEENRLLYVAATRAREKLLVSGHLTQSRGKWRADGWLKSLMEEGAGVDLESLVAETDTWHEINLSSGEPLAVWIAPTEQVEVTSRTAAPKEGWPASSEEPLYQPLAVQPTEQMDADRDEELEHTWRATGAGKQAPAVVVGRMVHAAIQRWLFPEDARLEALLQTAAIEDRLVDSRQRQRAILEARGLLTRFRKHPLWSEIDTAEERYHEVPYTWQIPSGIVDSGWVDLLFRADGEWRILDFKTDELRDEGALVEAVDRYRPQVERYSRAIQRLLGVHLSSTLCFLDYEGGIRLVEV